MKKPEDYIYINGYLRIKEYYDMKTLRFENQELLYQKTYSGGEYPDEHTSFYALDGKKEVSLWSWRKFRMIDTGVMVDNYIKTFELYFWIEDINHTKGYVRKRIAHNIELHNRPAELRRGEIV